MNNVLGKSGMRGALLLPILLSACAVLPGVSGGGVEAEKPSRQSVATPQRSQQPPAQKPVQPQQQAPVQAQQPAPADQGTPPAQKPKHNVEED